MTVVVKVTVVVRMKVTVTIMVMMTVTTMAMVMVETKMVRVMVNVVCAAVAGEWVYLRGQRRNKHLPDSYIGVEGERE